MNNDILGRNLVSNLQKSLATYVSTGQQQGRTLNSPMNPLANYLSGQSGIKLGTASSFMKPYQTTSISPTASQSGGLIGGQIGQTAQPGAVSNSGIMGSLPQGSNVFQTNPFMHYLAMNFGPHAQTLQRDQPNFDSPMPVQGQPSPNVMSQVQNKGNVVIPNKGTIPSNFGIPTQGQIL